MKRVILWHYTLYSRISIFQFHTSLDHITIFATPTEGSRCEATASYRKGGQPAVIQQSQPGVPRQLFASMSEARLEVLVLIQTHPDKTPTMTQ